MAAVTNGKADNENTALLSSADAEGSRRSNSRVRFDDGESGNESLRFASESESIRSSFGRGSVFISRYLNLKWTDSLRIRTSPKVYPAAFLLRDAILGSAADMTEAVFSGYDYFDPYSHENSTTLNAISRVCRRMLTYRVLYYLEKIAIWVLVLLSAVEPPFWCRDYPYADVTVEEGFGECWTLFNMRGPPAFGDEEDVQYYPSFFTPWLSVDQSLAVEWACIGIILALMIARFGVDGLSFRRHFFLYSRSEERNRGAKIIRLVRTLSVFALMGGMMSSAWIGTSRSVALILRIVICLTYSKPMQRELNTVIRVVPEIASILVILLVIIIFYGWIGCVLFYETDEGEASFPNLIEGCWSLWIMVTTANYPDVMQPAYNANALSCIYFVSFMIITFFFVMNVVLASVVNSYQNDDDRRKEMIKSTRKHNLASAFKLLDEDEQGWISRETIMSVFLVLNEDCPEIRYIEREEAELLFAILDANGENRISEEEFGAFCKVMLLQFERASLYTTSIERNFPTLFHSPRFQAFSQAIKSEKFEHVIDAVVALNAVFVAIQSYPQLAGEPSFEDEHIKDGYIDTVWESFQTAFTIIYCIEMTIKILVLGWKRYSEAYRNLFDAFITVLSLASTIYVYYPNRFSDSRLIRFIVMARVLRLVRVLVAIKKFQIIGATFIDILPAAKRILLFLFGVMYIFSAIGMQLFGGLICRDPSNPLSERLRDTDFAEAGYFANNFNDMLSGFNVLFNLLVVNNWTTQADGILAVTGTKASRFYFIGFHLVGVIIVCNLVVAFIIDSFIDEWDEAAEMGKTDGSHDTGEALINEKRAVFDANEITGTKTNLDGKFVARLFDNNPDLYLSMRHNDELKRLFTKVNSNVGET